MEDAMARVTVSPKYQVVIPKEVRDALKLRPGDKLEIFAYGDRIAFIPIKRTMKQMRGFLKGKGIDSNVERDPDRL
jgi:AbrB family looped-hinge helix DNA binding protein